MMTFLTRFVLGASAFIGHAAATGNDSDNLKSLPLLMNPNGVACHDEFHITSARLCVVAAKRMRITKMKIHIDSKFQPPYGCSLKGKTMYFNGDKNAKPPKKSVTPICRIRPECYMCDPDPSMNPSVNPSKKHSSNPSLKLSMNPSKRFSVEPSVEPTIIPATQPSVHPSVNPSKKLSFNPSVKLSMNPSKRFSVEPSVEPTIDLTTQPSVHPSKFVDPSSTFTFNGRKNIERAVDENDYDGTIAKPPTDYVLRFTIEPQGKLSEWGNIIHITTGVECCGYGFMVPIVSFESDTTRLVVGTDIRGSLIRSVEQLPINIESEIEILVVGTLSTLFINGVAEPSTSTGDRSLLSDVKVYLGSPREAAADAIISNVYFGPA